MSEPTVCCIMLTKDRPALAARAVRCFRQQTYERKRLLIVNSEPHPITEETEQISEPCFIGAPRRSCRSRQKAAHGSF
jgi:hypothetical protein